MAQGTYTEVGRPKARSSKLDGPLGASSTSDRWVCAHLDRRLLPRDAGLLRVTRGREFHGSSAHHWALAFALHFTQDGNENLRISETWGSCVFIILTCGLGPYRSAKSEQSISVSKEKPHKALRPAQAPACHRAHLGEDKQGFKGRWGGAIRRGWGVSHRPAAQDLLGHLLPVGSSLPPASQALQRVSRWLSPLRQPRDFKRVKYNWKNAHSFSIWESFLEWFVHMIHPNIYWWFTPVRNSKMCPGGKFLAAVTGLALLSCLPESRGAW